MRIVRRPAKPASRKKRNRSDGALDYGTIGMSLRSDAGETTPMTSGATWTPRAVGLTSPNKPSGHQAQAVQSPSPMTTAPTGENHPTNTRLYPGVRLSSMTIAGWATRMIDARFSHQPAHPSLGKAPPNPNTDLTWLLHDPTKSPCMRPMRQLLRLSPAKPRSGLRRWTTRNGIPFDQPPISRTVPLSAQYFFPLVYVTSFCVMLHLILVRVWRCAAYCAVHPSTMPCLSAT